LERSRETCDLADIDWDNLGFGLQPTDYMYIMKCARGGTFSKGQLQRFGNIELNPSAGILNYGQVGLYFIWGITYSTSDFSLLNCFLPENNAYFVFEFKWNVFGATVQCSKIEIQLVASVFLAFCIQFTWCACLMEYLFPCFNIGIVWGFESVSERRWEYTPIPSGRKWSADADRGRADVHAVAYCGAVCGSCKGYCFSKQTLGTGVMDSCHRLRHCRFCNDLRLIRWTLVSGSPSR